MIDATKAYGSEHTTGGFRTVIRAISRHQSVHHRSVQEPNSLAGQVSSPGSRQPRPRSKLIVLIAGIACIGAAIIVLDLERQRTVLPLTIDFLHQDATVAEWWHSGFLRSLDQTTGTLEVNEEMWRKLAHDQKMGVASLLKWYYSEHNEPRLMMLTVKGDVSQEILVRLVLAPAH